MSNPERLSAADRKARARLARAEEHTRTPTIDPAVGVNRAKQEAGGNLTPPTDPNNPGATAARNGEQVVGKESPDAALNASNLGAVQTATLPEGLTAQHVAALDAAGIKTLNDTLTLTDAELDAIPNIGAGAITTLRDGARAAGLTWAGMEAQEGQEG